MKRLIVFMLCCACLYQVYAADKTDELLRILDKSIANKAFFLEKKQASIDAMKATLLQERDPEVKLNNLRSICDVYSTFEKDSSLAYISQMDYWAGRTGRSDSKLYANIVHANILGTIGYFQEAQDLISLVDRSQLQASLLEPYYMAQITIQNYLESYAANPVIAEEHRMVAQKYRDSLLLMPLDEITRAFFQAPTLLGRNAYTETIELLLPLLDKLPEYSRNSGIIAYNMALAYIGLNDSDNAIHYFTLSSIADIRNGIREYKSLRSLATMLFERNDIKRAYSYMKCAMEDAILCNAKINTLEASEMFIIITGAFQEREIHNRQRTNMFLVLFIFLCFVFMGMYVLIWKQNKKIAATNELLQLKMNQIAKMNEVLSETSHIKEEYVGLYMEQYTNYLSKVSSFQKRALKIARGGDLDAVIIFLNSVLNVEAEVKDFYNNFDTTILNLFPNFISDFNSLLEEGEAIVPKKNELLTPELRIFALIRLGINDSVKIAHFLQYSLSTIYNYRTKMRNKAKGDRTDFENKVMSIGSHRERTSEA